MIKKEKKDIDPEVLVVAVVVKIQFKEEKEKLNKKLKKKN